MPLHEIVSISRARTLLASGEARRRRHAHRLSLREVATVLGVEPATVCRWETGDHVPRAENALMYVNLLDEVAAAQTSAREESSNA